METTQWAEICIEMALADSNTMTVSQELNRAAELKHAECKVATSFFDATAGNFCANVAVSVQYNNYK